MLICVCFSPRVFALLVLFPPTSLRAGVGEWTSSGPEGGSVEALASHPSHPPIVYAATLGRLYKSVDAGATWAPTGLAGGFNLVLPTSDPSVAYAAATLPFSESPIYRTRDGGETWVERPGPAGTISALDLGYTLTVTDRITGAVRTYISAAKGNRLCGAADTAAFRN